MPQEVRQLIDRQQIYDCIVRYCSGVDRFDAYAATGVAKRDRSDPSYQRPMEIRRLMLSCLSEELRCVL